MTGERRLDVLPKKKFEGCGCVWLPERGVDAALVKCSVWFCLIGVDDAT